MWEDAGKDHPSHIEELEVRELRMCLNSEDPVLSLDFILRLTENHERVLNRAVTSPDL